MPVDASDGVGVLVEGFFAQNFGDGSGSSVGCHVSGYVGCGLKFLPNSSGSVRAMVLAPIPASTRLGPGEELFPLRIGVFELSDNDAAPRSRFSA